MRPGWMRMKGTIGRYIDEFMEKEKRLKGNIPNKLTISNLETYTSPPGGTFLCLLV